MKKRFAYMIVDLVVLAVLALILSAHKPITTADATYSALGDVNGDGFVDTFDSYKILEAYAKHSAGVDNREFTEIYDVDSNGTVNTEDAYLVLQCYALNCSGNSITIEEMLSAENTVVTQHSPGEKLVLVASSWRVFECPDWSSEHVAEILGGGEVTISKYDGDGWYLVVAGGQVGYMHINDQYFVPSSSSGEYPSTEPEPEPYVEPEPVPQPQIGKDYYVVGNTLQLTYSNYWRLRATQSLDSYANVIREMQVGETVTIRQIMGGYWFMVETSLGEWGYICVVPEEQYMFTLYDSSSNTPEIKEQNENQTIAITTIEDIHVGDKLVFVNVSWVVKNTKIGDEYDYAYLENGQVVTIYAIYGNQVYITADTYIWWGEEALSSFRKVV